MNVALRCRVQRQNAKAPRRSTRDLRGAFKQFSDIGAGDEIRTHDPNLGKVMLYP